MAIHPAQFSGRRPTVRRQSPRTSRPAGFSKLVKWAVLLLTVALLGYGAKQALSLLQPLPSLPNQKNYPIGTNSKDRTNLLLVSFQEGEVSWMAVASLAPGEKVLFLALDPNLMEDLAGSHGSYRLGAAWKLGNLGSSTGINLLRDSVSRVLAIPIDGYLALDQAAWGSTSRRYGSNPSQIIQSLSNPTFVISYLAADVWPAGLSSSLSRREALGLLLNVRSGDGVRELSLEGTLLDTSVGGQSYKTIEADSFDGRVGQQFQELSIAQTHPKVSIVNASGIPGAAVELARYVHNLGGEVIAVDSAETPAKKSIIRDHRGTSNLGSRLASLILADVVRDNQSARADLEITIGENAQNVF